MAGEKSYGIQKGTIKSVCTVTASRSDMSVYKIREMYVRFFIYNNRTITYEVMHQTYHYAGVR